MSNLFESDNLFQFMKTLSQGHATAVRYGAESASRDLMPVLEMARRLRDEPFESREEFRECLNTLCDALASKVGV